MKVEFEKIEQNETVVGGKYFSVCVDAPNEETLTHGNLYSGDRQTLKQLMNYLEYGEELREGIDTAINAIASNPTMSELEILTGKLKRLYNKTKA